MSPDLGDDFRRAGGIKADIGQVVAEGCLVKGYLEDKRWSDFDLPLVGREVLVSRRGAIRIEIEGRLRVSKSDFSLYRCWRKDILAVR